jgi:hypothetical protein
VANVKYAHKVTEDCEVDAVNVSAAAKKKLTDGAFGSGEFRNNGAPLWEVGKRED